MNTSWVDGIDGLDGDDLVRVNMAGFTFMGGPPAHWGRPGSGGSFIVIGAGAGDGWAADVYPDESSYESGDRIGVMRAPDGSCRGLMRLLGSTGAINPPGADESALFNAGFGRLDHSEIGWRYGRLTYDDRYIVVGSCDGWGADIYPDRDRATNMTLDQALAGPDEPGESGHPTAAALIAALRGRGLLP